MNRIRKAWSVMLGAALLLSALPAHADPYWQMHWEPGRYTVAMTAEQEAQITPVCFDDEESGLPVTAWQIAVYAHDGSICGYREVSGAG